LGGARIHPRSFIFDMAMTSVFQFFPLCERVQLRLVSKGWRDALDDDRNWRAVDFGSMGAAPPRQVPKLLGWVVSEHGRHIHDISTRGCFVSDDAISAIGGNCPNLEVLIADEFVQE